MSRHDDPVVVIGAGLAGLSCAVGLHRAGLPVVVVEASDGVGGRVRTDRVDGYIVDRGFQVLLTAYPELSRQLDVAALDLRAFDPGAMVWADGRGAVVADPFRSPRDLISTIRAPIGSLADKLHMLSFRRRIRSTNPVELLRGDDVSSVDGLRAAGFSDAIIDRFFRPLFGGIQLDPELGDSRRMSDIIFRMLADGDSAVPSAGMQAIPEQLAGQLPAGTVQLGARVAVASADSVSIVGADELAAAAVVIATDGPSASALLDIGPVTSKPVGCVYFASDEAPTDRKLVILDGTGRGPVLNVAVMSNIAPTYAPRGRHLVVAAMPGVADTDLVDAARRQLRGWWGPVVDRWDTVATYAIAHGQPGQRPPFQPRQTVSLADGRFVCGDHRDTASIQGALYSGRRCADAVIATLQGGSAPATM